MLIRGNRDYKNAFDEVWNTKSDFLTAVEKYLDLQ